jgi:hypothetical protein
MPSASRTGKSERVTCTGLCPNQRQPQILATCRFPPVQRILAAHGHQIPRQALRHVGPHRAQKAADARREADKLACDAWNKRMLAFKGPAQPSSTLSDALNAGSGYLEVRCLGCDIHQTVAHDIVRRPKATPIHEPERYMRCKDCSEVRSHPYKRSHLLALRRSKISASDPPLVAGGAMI